MHGDWAVQYVERMQGDWMVHINTDAWWLDTICWTLHDKDELWFDRALHKCKVVEQCNTGVWWLDTQWLGCASQRPIVIWQCTTCKVVRAVQGQPPPQPSRQFHPVQLTPDYSHPKQYSADNSHPEQFQIFWWKSYLRGNCHGWEVFWVKLSK